MVLACSDIITPAELSETLRQYRGIKTGSASLLKGIEAEQIERVLGEAGGNKTVAAARLGLSREGLRKKLKRLEAR